MYNHFKLVLQSPTLPLVFLTLSLSTFLTLSPSLFSLSRTQIHTHHTHSLSCFQHYRKSFRLMSGDKTFFETSLFLMGTVEPDERTNSLQKMLHLNVRENEKV